MTIGNNQGADQRTKRRKDRDASVTIKGGSTVAQRLVNDEDREGGDACEEVRAPLPSLAGMRHHCIFFVVRLAGAIDRWTRQRLQRRMNRIPSQCRLVCAGQSPPRLPLGMKSLTGKSARAAIDQ